MKATIEKNDIEVVRLESIMNKTFKITSQFRMFECPDFISILEKKLHVVKYKRWKNSDELIVKIESSESDIYDIVADAVEISGFARQFT